MGLVALGVGSDAGDVLVPSSDRMHCHPIDLVGNLLDAYARVMDGYDHRTGLEVPLVIEL